MDSSKVIITMQKEMTIYNLLENEVGMSTYDLALMYINKFLTRIRYL